MEEFTPRPGHRFIALLETGLGAMEIELLPDRAPKTVSNFVNLARQGFYDGLTFHRIVRDFMVQGGCPRGDGTGGPGYTIPAEFNDLAHEKGVISMARGEDPDSAGSQFFIVHASGCAHLDGAYTAFGRLEEGFDTLDAIAQVPVEWNGSERSRPVEAVAITTVRVEEREIPVVEAESQEEDGVDESTVAETATTGETPPGAEEETRDAATAGEEPAAVTEEEAEPVVEPERSAGIETPGAPADEEDGATRTQ